MRLFRISLLFALCLVAACASTHAVKEQDRAAGLTFIHINDTYRVDAVEEQKRGGFGRVVTLIRQLQKDGRDVRVLHGGDFLYPSLESQIWNGEQMVDAMNFIDDIAPMYVVPGNHEFDRRDSTAVVNAVRMSHFDWLGDNWSLQTGAADVDANVHSGFMFETGGHKVGIFALTLHADDGGNDRDYLKINGDYLAEAKRAIAELDGRGADLIIGLTHLHIWTDMQIAELKAQYPQFLGIVGGHDHEPEDHPGTAVRAAVMKGASNARAVWRINVEFGADGKAAALDARMITIDEHIIDDPAYTKIEEKWRSRLLAMKPFLKARIGTAESPLDAREATVRSEESAWGNYIADQMRKGFGKPVADFAFINGGTLRLDDYIADDITFEDISRTFGFSSFMRFITLSGADFKEVLEAGYRGAPASQGYFPQVSGFRVCFDRSRPEGDRIVRLELPAAAGWKAVDPATDYTLAVPDFLYGGGDGYNFAKARNVSRPASELKYLVIDAITREQAAGRSIAPVVDSKAPRLYEIKQAGSACFK